MTIRFGDKVNIVNDPFYAGATGRVIYFDQGSDQYEVMLDGSPYVRSFFIGKLKKQTVKRKRVKK